MSLPLMISDGLPRRSSQNSIFASDPAFKRFLIKRLMQRDLPSDSPCALVARRVLQLCAIFVASSAQLGMVSINMDAAGGNKGLGGVLVASNLSTFGSFYAYCSWIILNEAFKTLSPEEQELFKSEIPSCIRNSLKVGAAVTGAFSQVPMAYAAYYSNNSNLFYAITRFLDAGLPIRSLYLGAKALFSNLNLNDTEKKLEKSRKSFDSLIKQKQSTLLLSTPQVKKLLNELPNIRMGSMEDYLKAIISLPSQPAVDSKVVAVSKNVMWGIGHLSNLLVMALYGIITYNAMSLITDDEGLKICAAILVIACKFYLWKDSVTLAAKQFPMDTQRLLGAETQRTISQNYMPKTDALATGAAYVIGGFSYGSMKYFCDLYGLGTAGTAVSSVATALLAKNTFTALKDGCIENGLVKWGNEEQKKLINFYRELKKLSSTLNNTNRIEWAKFLMILPKDIKELFNNELSELEIYTYLKTKNIHNDSPTHELDTMDDDITTPLNKIQKPIYGTQANIQIEEE